MFTNNEEATGSFTFEAEGSMDSKNPYYIGKLSRPDANSGVTIGAGYDMQDRTEAEVKRDLTGAGMETTLAEKLAKGAGLKGAPAETFVRANQATLVVNNLNVLRRLFTNIYPGYVTRARKNFQFHSTAFQTAMKTYGKQFAGATFFDWQYLFPAIRVIAIDFVYQGFGRPSPGYGKPLHICMANDFDWLIDYITHTAAIAKFEAGRHRAAYLRAKKDFEVRNYSNCSSP